MTNDLGRMTNDECPTNDEETLANEAKLEIVVKLRHVHIENFKGVKNLDISLADGPDDTPRRMTCLIGDNGSGKTTVLQAIALTLSLATRRIDFPTDFRWQGFLPGRVGSQGHTVVKLQIDFDQEELNLVSKLHSDYSALVMDDLREMTRDRFQPPNSQQITITYSDGEILFQSNQNSSRLANQLLGRYFIHLIYKINMQYGVPIEQVGDVFWFDQYRNLGTVFRDRSKPGRSRAHVTEGWRTGVEQLRESLVGWWAYNANELEDPDKNAIKILEQKFANLFPGTRFRGPKPRNGVIGPGVKDFFFLLEREGRQYDLAEMASGEQAVFSLLYDFVRLKIAKSIVLIDELELHLHPPAQQALYAALPRLGADCQFIITTHSEFLTGIIPDEYKVRLPGGRPCL